MRMPSAPTLALLALAALARTGCSQPVALDLRFDSPETSGAFATTAGGEGLRKGADPATEDGRLHLLQAWWKSATSVAFEAPAEGCFGNVELSWTLIMTRGTEGMGFAWLDTAAHGTSGAAPQPEAWEAPSIAGSFGIGFDASDPVNYDIFRGSGNIYGRPEYEVSLHWDGREIVKAVAPVDFRDEQPHKVSVSISFLTGGAEISLSIDEEPAFEHSLIPGMTAYVGRAAFGARNAETAGDVQIDDLHIAFAEPIDPPAPPLTLVAIDHELNDGGHATHEATVDFPADTREYGRIVCTLRLDKPEDGYDAWDRSGGIYIDTEEGERFELLRYITPYHNGHVWQVDVSDFRPLLKGPRKITQSCGTQGKGWVVSVIFDLYPGPAPRYASSVVKLWSGQCVIGDPDHPPAEFYGAQEIPIPEGATGAAVRTVVTGHGMAPNSQNAAEFMPIWRTLTVNGQGWRNQLWKADNYLNPCRPQGGTWKFDRAGWAPGDVVRPWVVDVSPLVGSGGSLHVEYRLDDYVNENRGQTWSPFHLSEGHVVFYTDRP